MIANHTMQWLEVYKPKKESINASGANVENFLQWKFAMEYEIFVSILFHTQIFCK